MYGTYIRKKQISIFLFVLTLSLFFTACSKTNSRDNSLNEASSNDNSIIHEEVLINSNEFSSLISISSESGAYILQPDNITGSYTIHYVDFESGCDVCLCSSPNCKHNDSSCTGFIPANCGGAMLAYNGNQLIEIILGNTIDTPAQIFTMDKDGQNKKMLTTFSSNQTVTYGYTVSYILSIDSIYLMLESCNKDSNQVNIENDLISVSLTSGEVRNICTFDNPSFFVGVKDNKIVIKELNGTTNIISSIDTITGQKDMLSMYDAGHILPFESNGVLYMLDFDKHAVYASDSPDTYIATFDFEGSSSLTKIRAVYDSKIIIDNSCIDFTNGDYKREDTKYFIDLLNGDIQKSSITIDKNGKSDLPWVYAVVGDRLLIDVGISTEIITDTNAQTGEIERYETENAEYGMIEFTDLFSDNFIYAPVYK